MQPLRALDVCRVSFFLGVECSEMDHLVVHLDMRPPPFPASGILASGFSPLNPPGGVDLMGPLQLFCCQSQVSEVGRRALLHLSVSM